MLKLSKLIEIIISLQIIIISTFIPVFFSIPFSNKVIGNFEIPITWQLPSIVIITLIFEGKILRHGSQEELANDEMVRKVYLGKNFELRKKTI